MEDHIVALLTDFAKYSKEYPIVAAGIGMWALGVGTYLIKTLPIRLWRLVIKHATTTLTIASSHISYHEFLQWYEENNYSHNSRSIKISNGRYGYDHMIKAMGYGTHYFFFGWTPVRLTLVQKEVQASERERDEVMMTVVGRSHKTFDKIFADIKQKKEIKTDKVTVMKFKDDWIRESDQRKRNLDSVCLNDGVRDTIVDFVDSFRLREDFNLQHGINHQTAIMLYGPPGTGKTSVIKAIASHYDLKIYNMSPAAIGNIGNAFASLPENSLVVIEDIDSNKSLFARPGSKTLDKSVRQNDSDLMEELMLGGFTSISDVLNAIDGVSVSHGRILLATTNHIESLDPALLRTGRFDLKVEIGYADNFALTQFLERFFPGKSLPNGYQIKDNICSADIQKAAIDNLDDSNKFLVQFRKSRKLVKGSPQLTSAACRTLEPALLG